MTRDPRQVAALVPAYHAAGSVGAVVRGCFEQVSRVLVVDDGSRDGTGEAARDAGAELLTLEENQGKGNALRRGFEVLFGEPAAGQQPVDAVVTVDADGQHATQEIPILVDAWQRGGDLVMGTRERLFREMSGLRRFGNSVGSLAISLVLGQRIVDVQTGFRLYTRPLITATGFPEPCFEAESAVVVRARRRGFHVVTAAVERGVADGSVMSHFKAWRDTWRIARAVARARLEKLPGESRG